MPSDWKPEARIRNPELLRWLHYRWRECALCGVTSRLSLHHIVNKPRHDLEANLVMVCGDGVRGCHGLIEANHAATLNRLMTYILASRPDTIMYLRETLGEDAAADWIDRRVS